ncbi:CHASE2 domain-containing protein [Benzoatithermus flavus]|uniref:Adenylate/guanylate cyclase domain-containing protein n=1 Tax=Benzoatithermus flavus TaxID=3108223 RepID=A0ABU8XS31_9PROT
MPRRPITSGPWLQTLPLALVIMLSSLGVLVGVLGLRSTGVLQPLELRAYDALLRLVRLGAPSDPRITLVLAREADLTRYDWPLSDDVLAEALERILAHEPRAIGLDLFRDRPVPPGHERLARLLHDDPRVFAVMAYPDATGDGVAPPPAIDDPGRIGFADMVTDPDGIVRRGLLLLGGGDEAHWSLALRLAIAYLAPAGIVPTGGEEDPRLLRLGATTYLPLQAHDGGYAGIDDGGYQFLLAYPAGRAGFTILSLGQVLAGDSDPAALAGRVVIVGTMAESVKDTFLTPLTGEAGMPGAELHAQITSQLVRQALGEARPLRPVPWPVDAAWTGLWCLLGGLAALGMRRWHILPLVVVAGPGTLFTVAFGLLAFGYWIALLPPLFGAVATMLLQAGHLFHRERAERAMLMQLFATHLSPRIAEALWQVRGDVLERGGLRPQALEATVLFSDVRGYTTISEAMTPSILMDWLNDYIATMADIVAEHDGVVLELTGDGVLAVFGVPISRSDPMAIARDARNAVRCALAMSEALPELNAAFRARGLPEAAIRIGIHTGPVVAGSLGSAGRRKYAVVGDTVNIAARLEGYDKGSFAVDGRDGSHCRILVSGATYACLGGACTAVSIGKLDLKGRVGPIAVYRIMVAPDRARTLEGAGR